VRSRVIQDEPPEPGPRPPAGTANRQEAPASGTLVAHATEGSINVDGRYPQDSADATRAVVFNLLLWCTVAVTLLVADRRFWTSPAPDDTRDGPWRRRPGREGNPVSEGRRRRCPHDRDPL
jgi:hypothetical protein